MVVNCGDLKTDMRIFHRVSGLPSGQGQKVFVVKSLLLHMEPMEVVHLVRRSLRARPTGRRRSRGRARTLEGSHVSAGLGALPCSHSPPPVSSRSLLSQLVQSGISERGVTGRVQKCSGSRTVP